MESFIVSSIRMSSGSPSHLLRVASATSSTMQSSITRPFDKLHMVLRCTSSIGGPPRVVVNNRSAWTNVRANIPEPISCHCFSLVVISLVRMTGPGCFIVSRPPTVLSPMTSMFVRLMSALARAMIGVSTAGLAACPSSASRHRYTLAGSPSSSPWALRFVPSFSVGFNFFSKGLLDAVAGAAAVDDEGSASVDDEACPGPCGASSVSSLADRFLSRTRLPSSNLVSASLIFFSRTSVRFLTAPVCDVGPGFDGCSAAGALASDVPA